MIYFNFECILLFLHEDILKCKINGCLTYFWRSLNGPSLLFCVNGFSFICNLCVINGNRLSCTWFCTPRIGTAIYRMTDRWQYNHIWDSSFNPAEWKWFSENPKYNLWKLIFNLCSSSIIDISRTFSHVSYNLKQCTFFFPVKCKFGSGKIFQMRQ